MLNRPFNIFQIESQYFWGSGYCCSILIFGLLLVGLIRPLTLRGVCLNFRVCPMTSWWDLIVRGHVSRRLCLSRNGWTGAVWRGSGNRKQKWEAGKSSQGWWGGWTSQSTPVHHQVPVFSIEVQGETRGGLLKGQAAIRFGSIPFLELKLDHVVSTRPQISHVSASVWLLPSVCGTARLYQSTVNNSQ